MKPDEAMKDLAQLIEQDKQRADGKQLIVAVGEIGLDFEKDNCVPAEVQMQWFDAQLQLACQFGLPVILHIRGSEAFPKAFELLRSRSAAWSGAVNCFDGTVEQMKELINFGFFITWTGLLCNDSRADALRGVVASGLPDRYLIGSDAPHLIPFNMEKPYPKCNRPSTLPHVAAMLASILKMPVQQVASLTTANTRAAFKLPAVAFNNALPVAGVQYNANVFVEAPLVGCAKNVKPVNDAGKGSKKYFHALTDAEIAALLAPGQKAFVHNGFVYACPPGICTALEAMASSNNPALKSSLSEFVAAKVVTLVHDPTVRKKRKKKSKRHAEAGGRHVRRRVMPRHGGRRAGRGRVRHH